MPSDEKRQRTLMFVSGVVGLMLMTVAIFAAVPAPTRVYGSAEVAPESAATPEVRALSVAVVPRPKKETRPVLGKRVVDPSLEPVELTIAAIAATIDDAPPTAPPFQIGIVVPEPSAPAPSPKPAEIEARTEAPDVAPGVATAPAPVPPPLEPPPESASETAPAAPQPQVAPPPAPASESPPPSNEPPRSDTAEPDDEDDESASRRADQRREQRAREREERRAEREERQSDRD